MVSVNEIISAYRFDNFKSPVTSCIEKNDFWQIKYLHSGSMTIDTDEQSYLFQAGQLIIIPSDTKITITFEKNTALHYSIISFRCNNADFLYKISPTPITLHGINQINFNDFVYTASKIYSDKKQLNNHDPILEEYHRHFLETFLMRIYFIYNGNNIFPDTYKPAITYNDDMSLSKTVREYMENHIECDLSLDILAHETGVSKNTLMRKFRADTGLSIMQYFTKIKIEKAANMICDTDLSLKTISEQLNFQSPSYFSTAFKKQMGISPLEFSKRSLKWKGCLADFC